jgi:hypothetical protein
MRELVLMTKSDEGEWGSPGHPGDCSVETEQEGLEALRNLVETCPEYRDCAVLVEIRRNCTNSSGRNIGTLYDVIATAAEATK